MALKLCHRKAENTSQEGNGKINNFYDFGRRRRWNVSIQIRRLCGIRSWDANGGWP